MASSPRDTLRRLRSPWAALVAALALAASTALVARNPHTALGTLLRGPQPASNTWWGAIVLRTQDRFRVITPDESADMVARSSFDRPQDLAHVRFTLNARREGFWAPTRSSWHVSVMPMNNQPWSRDDQTAAVLAIADYVASPTGWSDQARADRLRASPLGASTPIPLGYVHNALTLVALAVLLFSLAAAPEWVVALHRRRARRRLRAGRCPHCLYPLAGLAAPRCPECGRPLISPDPAPNPPALPPPAP